jgi:hypothetical protein
LVEKISKDDENYERKLIMMAANYRMSQIVGASEDNNLFDKKERIKMVKAEGEKLLKQRQDELIARMKKAEE